MSHLSERNIEVSPDILVRAENEQEKSDDDVRNTLLQVLGVTLGEIQRECREIEEDMGFSPDLD